MNGHLVVVEFRNRRWLSEARSERTLDWLRSLAAAHTVVDEPQEVGNFAHGVWQLANPALVVVRLHRRNADTWNQKGLATSAERFNYEYSESELDELTERVAELARHAFVVAVLINANHDDQGVRAARAILDRLSARVSHRESTR